MDENHGTVIEPGLQGPRSGSCNVVSQHRSMPELVGSVISTLLTAVGIFIFNWKMALAALWVLPVSFGILLLTAGIMRRSERRVNQAQITCAEGIQECLESVRDLKANKAENEYLRGLDAKIKMVEKQTVISELTHAVCNTTARMILKLGIATTILVGGMLLVGGAGQFRDASEKEWYLCPHGKAPDAEQELGDGVKKTVGLSLRMAGN